MVGCWILEENLASENGPLMVFTVLLVLATGALLITDGVQGFVLARRKSPWRPETLSKNRSWTLLVLFANGVCLLLVLTWTYAYVYLSSFGMLALGIFAGQDAQDQPDQNRPPVRK